VLINPEELKKHDMNESRQKIYHELFGQDVLVNRTDGVVEQVYINGVRTWENAGNFTDALGTQTLGRAVRANA